MYLEAFNLRTDEGVTFDAQAFRMQGLMVEALPYGSIDGWELILTVVDNGWAYPFLPGATPFTDLDFGHPNGPHGGTWPLFLLQEDQ